MYWRSYGLATDRAPNGSLGQFVQGFFVLRSKIPIQAARDEQSSLGILS
jgi:hypothetical protein